LRRWRCASGGCWLGFACRTRCRAEIGSEMWRRGRLGVLMSCNPAMSLRWSLLWKAGEHPINLRAKERKKGKKAGGN
jgi:hypothetical protein